MVEEILDMNVSDFRDFLKRTIMQPLRFLVVGGEAHSPFSETSDCQMNFGIQSFCLILGKSDDAL